MDQTPSESHHPRGKLHLLKVLLRTFAVIDVGCFSASHWFFPARYFHSLGVTGVNFATGFVISQLHLIGALVVGLALMGWVAASDPIGYRPVIRFLFVTGVLCTLIWVYHIVMGNLPPRVWWNVVVVVVQLMVVGILYPWSSHGRGSHDSGVAKPRADRSD
ncbi:MAG: hypothetical protein HYZ89_05260 [Candidatus Omnitrophica bacterium]|nr:hypothetical protein [Candidatus Omnitrophota bacterium]